MTSDESEERGATVVTVLTVDWLSSGGGLVLVGTVVASCCTALDAGVVEVVEDFGVVEVGTTTVVSSFCELLTAGIQSISHSEIKLVRMGRTSRPPCCFDVFMVKGLLSLWEPRISNLISSQSRLGSGLIR